ncbi:hypothetical protein [Acinetobacter bereziniae]|uniref:hypothetical protein n=1 Tax=Acinetobacter bereziniae TaxID=106648 RepID=UPI0018DD43EA|nr:hypothetical protein [Acinetobacter bereziniae]MBI0393154.1 hypothetical protein [Acinetobacter bereziniae]
MDINAQKTIQRTRIVLISSAIVLSMNCFAEDEKITSLIQLNDSELSEVQGQSLMSLSYIAPNDSINKMRGQGVGFYKLGLEAELELNANIKKLQLGCGGVNGAGGCDIDIDNLSLSGISDTRLGRVGSSAKLTNPFLEFAIKNPNASSTREVVGLRLSAEKVLGLLTAGTENSDLPNGINSLSGYLKIKDTTGTGYTQTRNMSYLDTNKTIDANINAKICLFLCVTIPLGVKSNNYSLNLDSAKADIFINGQTIFGNRMNKVSLNGYANINRINFSGNLEASLNITAGLFKLQKTVDGNITGLKANVSVDQNLGYIHKIPLNNPFSLSLQSQNVWWPNAEVTAQKGWWMAFEDSIDIGDVTPSQKINITNDVLKQVVDPISNYLTSNPIPCNGLSGCLGGYLGIGNVNLQNTSVNFPLKDLQLKNQNFAPNCYGSLKFC